ncbi:MAG: chitobiase/beta-hexosaminidase C-terminal domain-containing protein [Candidatus Gastranaerophilales bacterium]|nr:chitobiase/beta-hexosaminidase C-terminal domain-containing protein [Candidatus Gastranaerophilales bacterium]
MKCPNCGAEMAEGSLYCNQCGEDIHIVPDFEPELDENIQQTIKNIAEDIWENDRIEKEDAAETQKTSKEQKGYKKRIIFAIVLVVFLVAGTMGGIALYLHYSVDYQIDRARECMADGLYERAIAYYDRAIELDESNVDLMVELAEVYYQKNNKMEYEYLLREIVRNESASAEQLEAAYGKLIAIYRDREDYQTINDFLLESDNAAILALYPNYVALAPEFSVKAGYYNSIQPLKLTASGNGQIYYTLDGSDPDENSTPYTMPILLENGDYVIKAYFLNENGIASQVAEAEYHIAIEKLPVPEISVMSGDYREATKIEVTDDSTNVYYTTDGTDPNVTSTPYTGAIHMPLGNSIFRFIRIEDGRSSDIEERIYHLTLNTSISTSMAEDAVVDYRLNTGKIVDREGHFVWGSSDAYQYRYQYVTNINRIGDFYVIAEYLMSTDNTVARTGSYFAVDVYSGELFRLQIENGNYTLVEIEEMEIQE